MSKKEKKYIISRQKGLKLFLILISSGLVVFSIFLMIQNKKDEKFQESRKGIFKMIETYSEKNK